jgi:type IV pilus assembly protein PilM
MTQVTLFVEDSAIKLLVAKGRRVEKWAKLPLDPGLVSDGLILDETKVADNIRQLFKLQKISDKTVVAGLSGFNSVYRLISLPELPEAILPEAVQQEANRVVPVPMDQVYLSYQSMTSSAAETLVFLAAFPRNTTDALLRTLQKAGLRADVMDLAPLALCRTVNAPEAVVVDVSFARLDIAIMVERIPQVIRSLSLPGEDQSLSERLTSIVEEFNRTIAFYNSSHREKALGETVPIFVSGDLAQAPDTWQSLSGKAGYPVSALPSPMQLLEGFDPSEFMVNIGLALKQLPLEKEMANVSIVDFNALPKAEKKPTKKRSLATILLPIVIVLGIGGIFYMYNLSRNAEARNDLVRSQLELTQSLIPQQQAVNTDLEEQIAETEPQIEPIKAEADIYNTTFTALEGGRSQKSQSLTRIANLTPEDVALVYASNDEIMGYAAPIVEASIEYSGSMAKVVGRSRDLDAIFTYAKDLRGTGGFSDVIITSIERYEGETFKGYNFKFNLIE